MLENRKIATAQLHRVFSLFASLLLIVGTNLSTELKAQNVNTPQTVDEVVWLVGDEAILRSDIEQQKQYFRSEGMNTDVDADCFIPEQLAIQMLFLNQAKIDSIQPDMTQVNRYVSRIINNMVQEIGSKKKLEEYFNKPFSQIREEQRRLVMNNEITQSMRRHIVKDVRVTPGEIRTFYQSIPTDSLPFIPKTVEVQLLRIKPDVSLEAIDAIKQRLRQYSDDITSEQRDFSMLARLYSDDKRTAMQGGEYGFVARNTLEPEFASVIFRLNDTKRVSPIIETSEGYHIVQLIEKRGDMINFRHILLRPSVDTDRLEAVVSRLDSINQSIDSESMTFDEAIYRYSTDENSKNNAGLMVNTDYQSDRSGSSYFTFEELPQDISAQVGQLVEGERSKPFIIKQPNGTTEVAIALLRSEQAGHRANLNLDFQVVKKFALEKKKADVLDQWIRERLKSTYVFIAPDYRNCSFRYDGWIKE